MLPPKLVIARVKLFAVTDLLFRCISKYTSYLVELPSKHTSFLEITRITMNVHCVVGKTVDWYVVSNKGFIKKFIELLRGYIRGV